MEQQKIFASTGNYTLLEVGKAKLIGFIENSQHYVNGGCIIPLVVVFHYGTNHQDLFFFENGTLRYNSVYYGREWYLLNLYAELVKRMDISLEEFVEEIVCHYTMKEMGF